MIKDYFGPVSSLKRVHVQRFSCDFNSEHLTHVFRAKYSYVRPLNQSESARGPWLVHCGLQL